MSVFFDVSESRSFVFDSRFGSGFESMAVFAIGSSVMLSFRRSRAEEIQPRLGDLANGASARVQP
jgi:hypothetical protein